MFNDKLLNLTTGWRGVTNAGFRKTAFDGNPIINTIKTVPT